MSDRVCANCDAPISEEPTVLFCSQYCCIDYLNGHDDVPQEPVTA